ncbi:DUF2267 domain-containing protein [Yoonia sediminilitoris]|uniref:Uncharacterized protein (DUF2267 family) n=1 Tax=Yoonia sediminilitoris TaxID=1286148 RepID=A0A2T6KCV2_9RHOB|nr:DUF2267 domain-containing protein [Yoonia sediminilitoris]PUB12789.1 uncharacterized protein (DUF2267 family) [Yoonia sediminilitoris]RCW94268.1 uncharacterized protein (DUF2267 family) [Yoonia sediminilitoris]
MSALGLKIIDTAVHDANAWINEVDARTDWDDKRRSYRLLRQVLHVIRDHLNVDEAAQLGAQLPTLIRGIYYEGWNPSSTPVVERTTAGFVDRVQAGFDNDPMGDADHAIAAVIDVLDAHVSRGEMDDVKSTFTNKIRRLF